MTIEQIETWIAYAFGVVLVLTPFSGLLRPHALKWIEHSARTRTTLDDRLSRGVLRAIDALAYLAVLFPRITVGLAEVKRVRDAIKALERPAIPRVPPALMLLLVLALPMQLTTACAGSSQMTRARTILAASGQGVVAAEQVFEPQYAAAGERIRAEVETFAEYADRMHRWIVAASSIRMTAAALELAETQLDLIEQGAAGNIAAVLACVGVSLVELLDMLAAVIDVPDGLVVAIRTVSAIAGDRCDPAAAPDPATTEDAVERERAAVEARWPGSTRDTP